MKKKIVILGSTSSIGKSLLNIIKKDKKNFKLELLTANTNYKDLIKQAKKFNVKNVIITDPDSFKKTKIIPSILSSNPPCPGMIFPVFLILEDLLKYDIIKSPTWLTLDIKRINITNFKSFSIKF